MNEIHSLVFKVDRVEKFRELLSIGRVEEAIKETGAKIVKSLNERSSNVFTIALAIDDETDIPRMMCVCSQTLDVGFDLLRPPVIRDLERERLLEDALAV